MSDNEYPIRTAQLGSAVLTGRLALRSPVIAGYIGNFHPAPMQHSSVSGESHYVHSDNMNLASLGFAGAWGADGISMIKNSTYGYVGRSASIDAVSVRINCNKVVDYGNEWINFRELTVGEFVSALTADLQQQLFAVLKNYNAAIAKAKELNIAVSEAVTDPGEQYQPVRDLLASWVESCNAFINDNGYGLVAGIKWGAFGTVSLTFDNSSNATQWKYGGDEKFSYVDLTQSYSLEMAYNGEQNQSDASVSFVAESTSYGDYIKDDIAQWQSSFSSDGYSKALGVSPLSQAPQINTKDWEVSYPDFITPPTKPETQEEVSKVEPDSITDMALASAVTAAQEKDPTASAQSLQQDPGKKADTSGLQTLIAEIKSNSVSVSELLNAGGAAAPLKQAAPTAMLKATAASASFLALADDSKDVQAQSRPDALTDGSLVPLGVWIAKWTDLIPWLAVPVDNNVGNSSDFIAIQYRTMLQDLLTLSRLYLIAAQSGVSKLYRLTPAGHDIVTKAIGDEFGNIATRLQGVQSDDRAAIVSVMAGLSEDARKIYSLWAENDFLRNAELGMGLVFRNSRSIDNNYLQEKSVAGQYGVYSLSDCQFSGTNYSVFSQSLKVLPLIHPEGVFYAFGPKEGGLQAIFAASARFSSSDYSSKLIKFLPDSASKSLIGGDGNDISVRLYPVPLSAAKGIDWRGFTTGASLMSDQNLLNRLAALEQQLSDQMPWGLSSDAWNKGGSWSSDSKYKINNIALQHVGLVEMEDSPL